MGLSTRLAKPGDYLTEDVAGMPVLMTRGADGRVMAFANICRHRGAPVAQGCGNARAFTCPYHGWTYDLAGKLLGTTDKVGFAGLDLARHGLVRLPAAETPRHAVRAAQARAAGRERRDRRRCRPRPARGRSRGAASSRPIRCFRPIALTPRINWKFAIDTFLEGYHIPHLHRKTIAPYFIGNCGTVRRRGPARPHVRAADLDRGACARVPEGERNYRPHVISIYQLFPNTHR